MPVLQQRLIKILAIVLVLQAIAIVTAYYREILNGGLLGGDFTVFWEAAQKMAGGKIATLYDPTVLQTALLKDSASLKGTTIAPFVYPPPMAIMIWPLGYMDYDNAVAWWSVLPIPFFFWLLWKIVYYSQKDARSLYPWAALYSLPFVVVNMLSGQTGTWIACFFLTGVYGWQRKQWWAGIGFGAMILKPQLAILLPFILAASRQWRILQAAAVTALLLAALASLVLGWGIWADYYTMLQWFSRFASERFGAFASMVTGPYMSLHNSGVPTFIAVWMQALISLFILTVIIHLFREAPVTGLDMRLGLAGCGALLITPHSMAYDTPLLALGVMILFFTVWRKGWANWFELAAFVLILMMPYLQPLAMQKGLAFGWIALLIFFIALLQRYISEYQHVNQISKTR